MEKATLEPVSDDEIAEVASLISRAFRGISWHTEEELVPDFTMTEDQLRKQVTMAQPHGSLLQYKDNDGKRLACAIVKPIEEKGSTNWRFAWLAIDPQVQTTGLGQKMLQLIEDYAYQRGATTIDMNAVNARKNLIAWYQRRGYVLTGKTTPFPPQAVANRTDLCFVYLQKDLKA